MEYDETVYACAINRIFNYNCRDARKLTDRFPSPGEIFAMSAAELRDTLQDKGYYSSAILSPGILRTAEEEVRWARNKGVRIIYIRDKEYPRRLKECPDAPTVLFYMGCCGLNPSRSVAIVGTRKATSYGKIQCRRIIEHLASLADRPTVISGLAYGIDITAHLAAMEYGLPTIAVLPTGMDSIYPTPHRKYAIQIAGKGALVTDFPKGSTPMAITFLRRNRIIAGMADAVVLAESGIKGGGLITARTAMSYSRDVFAIPGRIGDSCSEGCNRLIEANGAAIISSPESISAAMGWNDMENVGSGKVFQQLFERSDYIQRNILLALSDEPAVERNALLQKTGADPAETLVRLTEMEIEGIIEADIYGRYILKVR